MFQSGGDTVDFFFDTPLGVTLCRPIPVLARWKDCFVLHVDICNAFGLDPEAGLAVAPASSTSQGQTYICDREIYPIDPWSSYVIKGCLLEEVEEASSDERSPCTPPRKPEDNVNYPVVEGESSPVFVNLCDSETQTFQSPDSPDLLEPELCTPIANLSKEDFKYADAFPDNTVFTTQVPADVDGNVTYGSHCKKEASKDSRGLSFSALPFFDNNRSWSHATRGTLKKTEDKWRSLGAKVHVRKVKCLGEAKCENEACSFTNIHQKAFIQKVFFPGFTRVG